MSTTRTRQKEETREAILDVAGRLLRGKGLDGAGVATIMNEAGLTHGGFYVHFRSRRDLLLATLRHTSAATRSWYFRTLEGLGGRRWVRAAVHRYLSPRHRDATDTGCVVAGLGVDVARQDQEMRAVFQEGLDAIVAEYRARLDEAGCADAEDRALALVALCTGGISLSRAVADRRRSGRILRACRELAERDLESLGRTEGATP